MAECFSLISNTDVVLDPEKKVIPKKEFAAAKKGEELLTKVRAEIADFKKEAATEAEELKELAFQEGFDEGLASLNRHLFALNEELKTLREEIHHKILPLAISAARKILGEELKLHPHRIVDIVMTSLKPVTQHKKIIIYVNKEDLQLLEKEKPKIKKMFEHLESLSIQEQSDVEPGGCMIQTEAGMINAQLETQWRAMEQAFLSFKRKS
jgi:type III secretion protein L